MEENTLPCNVVIKQAEELELGKIMQCPSRGISKVVPLGGMQSD